MGPRGEYGYRGDLGDDVIGPQGQKGDQGEIGEPGRDRVIVDNELQDNSTIVAKGVEGEKGLKGSRGEIGFKGMRGSVGLPVGLNYLSLNIFFKTTL
jgi:hypothetical protein